MRLFAKCLLDLLVPVYGAAKSAQDEGDKHHLEGSVRLATRYCTAGKQCLLNIGRYNRAQSEKGAQGFVR